MQDVRHAFRVKQTPVVTAAAILTLALGVGGDTAVFSVVHAVILRPLPYPNPDGLFELFESNRAGMTWRVSALNYLSWADAPRASRHSRLSTAAASTLPIMAIPGG
jgi:putative ABC transport system permease protein